MPRGTKQEPKEFVASALKYLSSLSADAQGILLDQVAAGLSTPLTRKIRKPRKAKAVKAVKTNKPKRKRRTKAEMAAAAETTE